MGVLENVGVGFVGLDKGRLGDFERAELIVEEVLGDVLGLSRLFYGSACFSFQHPLLVSCEVLEFTLHHDSILHVGAVSIFVIRLKHMEMERLQLPACSWCAEAEVDDGRVQSHHAHADTCDRTQLPIRSMSIAGTG